MSLFANHFEIFDLPPSFEIETETLTQRYRDLQRTVHPDNYANAPDRERRLAMQRATQVNEAFQTLKEPLSRGRYLLQLHGLDPNAENATPMGNEFLLEQMELHEELADLKRQRQPEALSHFLSQLERRMQKLTGTLSQQFAQHDYPVARDTVRQFQFFNRLQEEALLLEEELN